MRGGARKGAGRPPKPASRRRLCTVEECYRQRIPGEDVCEEHASDAARDFDTVSMRSRMSAYEAQARADLAARATITSWTKNQRRDMDREARLRTVVTTPAPAAPYNPHPMRNKD